MRKFLITLTVISLILSIVGTGVVVYIDTQISETPVVPTVSGE